MSAGESSHTDIAICYMKRRVDENLLATIKERIGKLHVDALSMNQESLAECLYPYKWYNPFPKFRFSERPDTAAASILEGSIIILVDNSPSCMILPSSVFDIIEEADDYYFPPVTGTYLRLSRMTVSVLTLLLTPVWLLLMQNPAWIPDWLQFIRLSDEIHVPLIYQLLLLEFAIDGLRLAAVNTPSMLTTPLSVIAGIVLGEYSVRSGWFNSETMLYMAFVTIANYSQASFELGYALKFMRVLLLLLTSLFNFWGFLAGLVIVVCAIVFNKTIAGKSYIYPLIPFSWSECKNVFSAAVFLIRKMTGIFPKTDLYFLPSFQPPSGRLFCENSVDFSFQQEYSEDRTGISSAVLLKPARIFRIMMTGGNRYVSGTDFMDAGTGIF